MFHERAGRGALCPNRIRPCLPRQLHSHVMLKYKWDRLRITFGHLDIISRASAHFDHVVIAVLENRTKSSLFTVDERIEMIRETTAHLSNVSVDSWSGLLKHLKQWALSKQLNFGLHDSDRLGDDMRQRDYYKMKEKMNEVSQLLDQDKFAEAQQGLDQVILALEDLIRLLIDQKNDQGSWL